MIRIKVTLDNGVVLAQRNKKREWKERFLYLETTDNQVSFKIILEEYTGDTSVKALQMYYYKRVQSSGTGFQILTATSRDKEHYQKHIEPPYLRAIHFVGHLEIWIDGKLNIRNPFPRGPK